MPKTNKQEDLVEKLLEKVKELIVEIQEHYKAIEEHREKDRDVWRSFNRRLESLEQVKSERGKKRRYRKKTAAVKPSSNEEHLVTAQPESFSKEKQGSKTPL